MPSYTPAASRPKGSTTSKPNGSTNMRKKNIAPWDINLDENQENILAERTRAERPLSTKQAQLDTEAMEKEMAAIQKKYKALEKSKRHLEKKTKASKTNKYDSDGDDNYDDDGFESEEVDPPSGKGFFAQSATSLGVVTSSTQPRKPLRRSNETRPLEDVNNIFNPLATSTELSRGRSSEPPQHRKSSPPLSRQELTSADRPSSHPSSPSPQTPSHDQILSTTSRTHRRDKRARSSSRSPSTGPPKKVIKCEWRNGKAPTGRPGARDYEAEVSNMILESIREYGALVVTCDPVPLPDKQIAWATKCWERVCANGGEEYELPDRVIGLIRARTSNARAPLKDTARSKVEQAYAFVKTSNPDGKQGRKNQKICRILLKDDAFVYRDFVGFAGLYETKLISECIQGAFFKNKKFVGVEFQDYFDPISLVTIALVLTAIEFSIGEWKTGVFIQAAFDEKTNADRFRSHLKGLHEWRDGAPKVVFNICTKLFKRAIRNAGGCVIEDTSHISKDALRRAQQELANRTGDTDSEDDGPVFEDDDEDEPEYEEPEYKEVDGQLKGEGGHEAEAEAEADGQQNKGRSDDGH